MRTTIARFLLVIASLTIGLLGGLTVAQRLAPETESANPSSSLAAPAPIAAEPLAQSRGAAVAASAALPDLSTIAEHALKAAANITSEVAQQVNDPFYTWVYGRNPTVRSKSLGSGVIVSQDGYVLTNTHVIGNARAEVIVTLADANNYPGKIVGIDEISDLAVIKIDAKGLDTLPWGDSSKLRVAEWVLAIGNPFQLSGTVTLGIVSTKSRSGSAVGAIGDFIQTDAAINSGNSGGALINAKGELIGINTMIYSQSGGNVGIGFAIPSNTARKIMDDLIKTGSVAWGSIGSIQWIEVEAQRARRAGYGAVAGLYVYDLDSGSSAYRAGLRMEDLVVSVNGQPTTSVDQLDRVVIQAPVGSTVKIDVVKPDGRRQSLTIPIVSRQSAQRRR